MKHNLYKPWIVVALRIVIGVTFIMSGFVKAIDPWGFIFKIDEYLAAMGFTMPRTLELVGAIGLSAAEFMTGFFLLTGCYKRGAVVIMSAMMAFMLPLTLWTWVSDPVPDCGCFGDFITLSNSATFWKNVGICIALVYLWAYNSRLKWGVYRPILQWIVAVITFLYISFVGLYGYNLQPMIDFRPFPEGSDLAKILEDEADGDVQDVVRFIYERDGVKKVFPMDNLPDSTWTYVDRIVETVITPSAGFPIYDIDDNEVTDEVIPSEGPFLLFVIPEPERADISGSYTANEFDKAVRRLGGSSACLIAAGTEGIRRWQDLSMASYPCYSASDTSLKELARGTISAVYIEDGTIVWKLPLTTFSFDTVDALNTAPETLTTDSPDPDDANILRSMRIDHAAHLRYLTIAAATLLVFLALFQQFLIGIWRKTKKRM